MDQLTLVTKLFATLGIDRKSPLLGAESWIAWVTMLISGIVGTYLGRDLTTRPLWAFIGAMMLGSVVLVFLTSFVYRLKNDPNDKPVPALGGFWRTKEASQLAHAGKSVSEIICLRDQISDKVWPPTSRGMARVVSVIALALFCGGLTSVMTLTAAGPSFAKTMHAWISDSEQALKQDGIVANQNLPFKLQAELAGFETLWHQSPFAEKQGVKQEELFHALKNAIQINRLRESSDTLKSTSLAWADETIRYFHQTGNLELQAESLVEKANIEFEIAQLKNPLPGEFHRHTEDANALMSDAMTQCASCNDDQKSEILRLWSRSLYDLARPPSGKLSDDWDGANLGVSYDKMREVVRLAPNELKNYTQLARVVQRAGENPPRRADPSWTEVMRTTLKELREKWANVESSKKEPDQRIPPLNIQAVLTLDTVFREWQSHQKLPAAEKRSRLRGDLKEIEDGSIRPQSEVLALLPNSFWRESFKFDARYDLARMYAMRYSLLNLLDGPNSDSTTSALKQLNSEFAGALSLATKLQRDSVADDLNKRVGLKQLNEEQRVDLRKLM
jgi:hypothetical protein